MSNSCNNSNNCSKEDYSAYVADDYVLDLKPTLFLMSATCLPNLFQMYLFVFKIKQRTYSNMCFLSLITCDFFVGALCLPSNIFYLNPHIKISYYFGISITIITYAQPNTGIATLILLTWHRLEQVAWPSMSSEKMTKLRTALLVSVWIFQYVIWTGVLVIMISIGFYDPSIPDITPPAFVILVLDLIFNIMPVALNWALISATAVLLVLKIKSNKKLTEPITPEISAADRFSQRRKNAKLRRNKKAVFCLLTMILTLIVSQTLFFVTWPLSAYGFVLSNDLLVASSKLLFANSILNPFILFIFHEKVQLQSKQLILYLFGRHSLPSFQLNTATWTKNRNRTV